MTKYLESTFDFDSDELIEVIDEVPYWSAPFGIKLLENVRLKKNIKALDIGFGAGFPITEIAMRLGNTSKVYGVDPWEAAIRRVKKKLGVYGISNVELIKGVAESLPIGDESIDLITSNNGINNVESHEQTLSECARVAKRGAQFVQTVNLDTSMLEFYDVLIQCLKDKGFANKVDAVHAHIHSKRKPLPQFLNAIENAGFEVRNVFENEFHYSFIDGTSLLEHYFIRLAFLPDWKKLVPEAAQEEVFAQVERELSMISERDGEVRLTIPFVVIDCTKK